MATSIFEIIGPIMTGPSSSHTAGMVRLGMAAHRILGESAENLSSISLTLSRKLKATYSGHKTDAGLIGGTIGMDEKSPQLKDAIEIAESQGIHTEVDFLPKEYPYQNTALIRVISKNGESHSMLGTSVGGGSILIREVDGAEFSVEADAGYIFVWLKDDKSKELVLKTGVMSKVTSVQQAETEAGKQMLCLKCKDAGDAKMIHRILADGLKCVCERITYMQPILTFGETIETYTPVESFDKLCAYCKEHDVDLAQAALDYESRRTGRSEDEIFAMMKEHYDVMKASMKKGSGPNKMLYGLTPGDDGQRISDYAAAGNTISGGIVMKAVGKAVSVMEYNGSMGCIVAAPTAGSAGIVAGCMAAVQEERGLSDEQIVKGLLVSAITGVVIAEEGASFSGSVGGCQGEIGISSAIAAAGLTSLFTKDCDAVVHSMAMSLKNLLGLICDPVAGPVEVPCIKRNSIGVSNAFTCADMALAGVRSYIPPDEVIDALIDVADRMPQELKAATVGGLACTKTAVCLRERLANGCKR